MQNSDSAIYVKTYFDNSCTKCNSFSDGLVGADTQARPYKRKAVNYSGDPTWSPLQQKFPKPIAKPSPMRYNRLNNFYGGTPL